MDDNLLSAMFKRFEIDPVKIAQETLLRNTETLVAAFINAHPHVPIKDICVVNEPTATGFRIRVAQMNEETP